MKYNWKWAIACCWALELGGLASVGVVRAQQAPSSSLDRDQLRLKRSAAALAASEQTVAALQEQIATEKRRSVSSDVDRDLNRETVGKLERQLAEAHEQLRKQQEEFKAAKAEVDRIEEAARRAEEQRKAEERRKIDEISRQEEATRASPLRVPSVSSHSQSADSNRYTRTPCGSVRDARTNLEWFVGEDRDASWPDAVAWATRLGNCGGGWALPTREQAASLYDGSKSAGVGFFTLGRYYPALIDPIFSGIGGGSWIWLKGEATAGKAPAYNLNQNIPVPLRADGTQAPTRTFAVRPSRPN